VYPHLTALYTHRRRHCCCRCCCCVLQQLTHTAEYGRPSLDPAPAHPHRRPGRSKYLKYFNRRSGASPRVPPVRVTIQSKILSFHITHCDGYHTKAIKGSDNGSQMGPNSNCVCVFTFRPNFPRRLLRQLSK